MTVVFEWELPHPPSKTVQTGPLVVFHVPVLIAPWGGVAAEPNEEHGDGQ